MKKRIPWGWILGLAAGLSFIVYVRTTKNPSRSTPATPVSVASKPEPGLWPMPGPPDREPVAVQRPTIPHLPPVTYVAQPDGLRHIDAVSLSYRLKPLIKQHPHADVREDMNRAIEDGEISFNWQAQPGIPALLQVIPKDDVVAHHGAQGGKEDYLVLRIDPDWLAGLRSDQDILSAMLVIYHEYQHFKQYKNGDERSRFSFRAQRDPVMRKALGYTQVDACKDMWRLETEAYAEECRLANTWGQTSMTQLCRYVDSPDWKHAVFTVFGKQKFYRRACLRVFAELAGHPNPGIFPIAP